MSSGECSSWSDWLAASPPFDEVCEVPKPISRSITAAHLRSAAGLVRDGYCTRDEVVRLEAMVASTLGSRRDVADGLLAMAENHDHVAPQRKAIEVGLLARDTRSTQRESAARTAKLCERVAQRLASGRIDRDRCSRLFEASGLFARADGDDLARRLRDMGRRCLATADCAQSFDGGLDRVSASDTLTRAEMLQLKHVLHTLATSRSFDRSSSSSSRGGSLTMWNFLTSSPSTRRRQFDNNNWVTMAEAVHGYETASSSCRGRQLEACDRIWCVSDLHADVARNRAWVEDLEGGRDDAIIVAGDVATCLKVLSEVLSLLVARYKHVFFVPGNHELWVARKTPEIRDSVRKFFKILEICDDLGVHTLPCYVGEDLVVPLFSWYRRFNETDAGLLEHFDCACRWPWDIENSLDDRVADFFIALNQGTLDWVEERPHTNVISLSHFVPRITELFPGFVTFRHVMGCDELDRQIERLDPRVHVFGHSHINVDELLGSTRFVQNALGHPSDNSAEAATLSPLLIWSSAHYSSTLCDDDDELLSSSPYSAPSPPKTSSERSSSGSCCSPRTNSKVIPLVGASTTADSVHGCDQIKHLLPSPQYSEEYDGSDYVVGSLQGEEGPRSYSI